MQKKMDDNFIRPTEEPVVPGWVKKMLRNKIFWIVLVIFILFNVMWQREGIGWAVGTLVLAGFIALAIFTPGRKHHKEDDKDEE